MIILKHYSSPLGEIILGSFNGELCICDWAASKRRESNLRRIERFLCAAPRVGSSDVIEAAETQLNEYFSGNRTSFDIPLLFTGTDFQNKVWKELLKIPFGTTISYAELACRVGDRKAVRAVASANASNPISIIVPCHRVIGSNNKLVGYAGGLDAKQRLINLEIK